MSDPDRKRPGILLAIGKGFCLIVLAFIGLLILGTLGLDAQVGAFLESLWHLATGFVPFLETNLRKVSGEPGTWGPGLVAFLLGLVVIHRFGAASARRRERSWRISNTIAIGMLLPLLFAISFLVPGAILQIGSMRQEEWFQSNRSDRAFKVIQARNIAQAAHSWAAIEGNDRLPSSTAVIISADFLDESNFRPRSWGDEVGEPPLYLGAGLTIQSDPSLPLVISDVYSRNKIHYRTVITIGSEFVEISPEEVDEWIARTMAARDGVKP